jgi:hypothetical protein
MDVIKSPCHGRDELILLQDDAFDTVDSFIATNVLAAAVRKIGQFDIILWSTGFGLGQCAGAVRIGGTAGLALPAVC